MTGFGARAVVEAELRRELFGPSGKRTRTAIQSIAPAALSGSRLRRPAADSFLMRSRSKKSLPTGIRFDATGSEFFMEARRTRAP